MSEPIRYPLCWPTGWKRTPTGSRTRARFSTARTSSAFSAPLTIAIARDRLRDQLRGMGIDPGRAIISSNLLLRLDGLPRSGQPEPTDPGVAVYWTWRGESRCMAIDRYDRTADNLAAIAATLDAMRAIERHGGAAVLDRAFTGFAALPGPAAVEPWHVVLGVAADAPKMEIKRSYQWLRSKAHPDKGGSPEEFQRIEDAWVRAQIADEAPR